MNEMIGKKMRFENVRNGQNESGCTLFWRRSRSPLVCLTWAAMQNGCRVRLSFVKINHCIERGYNTSICRCVTLSIKRYNVNDRM